MDYNAFKAEIVNRVSLAANPDCEVELRSIRKLNGVTLDGITIMEKSAKIAPTIYLDHYYDMYQGGCSLDLIAGYILRENKARRVRELPADVELGNFEFVRPKLGIRLIHADMNRELLFGVPHFRVLDLAAVCYLQFSLPEADHGAVMVKNEYLSLWNIGADALFREALAGSMKNEPALLEPLRQMLEDIAGCSAEEDGDSRDEQLYVLTNKSKNFGASCMLYPHVLANLADFLGDDLVVLPSSVHEVLLMPRSSIASKAECDALVAGVNATELAPYEVLSNHAYVYSRKRRKLEM